MTHGRGAWNNSGAGGTKAYKDENKPGPYYYIGSGSLDPKASQDNFAVRHAVKAYQHALNRRLSEDIATDGIFGGVTKDAVIAYQKKHTDLVTPWGGIGPDTSMLILLPDLTRIVEDKSHLPLTPVVVSGLVRHESSWDAGAVGYVDNSDLGLAQINGPSHPELTAADRLRPQVAFNFIVSYMNNALAEFGQNLRDAVASYNLGIGGARTWIRQGRPEWYTPLGTTTARNVWEYIDSVLKG